MQTEGSPLESADRHARAKSDDLAQTCFGAPPGVAIVPGITRNKTAAAERGFRDAASCNDKSDTAA